MKLGTTVSQSIYLSGCSGNLSTLAIIPQSQGNINEIFSFVYPVVLKYKLEPYTKNLSIYFSTLIYHGMKLHPNILTSVNEEMKVKSKKLLRVEDIVKYYYAVQKIMNREYVFSFCTTNGSNSLTRSPKEFWNLHSNIKNSQVTLDAIYTLWYLSQIDIKLKIKLMRVPYVPPYLGYDDTSFQGEFRVFYSKKDQLCITREKIHDLYYPPEERLFKL